MSQAETALIETMRVHASIHDYRCHVDARGSRRDYQTRRLRYRCYISALKLAGYEQVQPRFAGNIRQEMICRILMRKRVCRCSRASRCSRVAHSATTAASACVLSATSNSARRRCPRATSTRTSNAIRSTLLRMICMHDLARHDQAANCARCFSISGNGAYSSEGCWRKRRICSIRSLAARPKEVWPVAGWRLSCCDCNSSLPA